MVGVRFADGTSLSFSDEALAKIKTHLDAKGFGLESGGILLGSRESEHRRFVVDDVTLPSKLDRVFPFSFVRSRTGANRAIAKAWKKSQGSVNYLGEWHTHNESHPIPSAIDRRLAEDLMADGVAPFDCFFMLIVGNETEAYVAQADGVDKGVFRDEVHFTWQE